MIKELVFIHFFHQNEPNALIPVDIYYIFIE